LSVTYPRLLAQISPISPKLLLYQATFCGTSGSVIVSNVSCESVDAVEFVSELAWQPLMPWYGSTE